jgi:hypothetical protein
VLDVFLKGNDDAEVRHLKLRADAGVGRHIVAERLADDRPFASVRDLHRTHIASAHAVSINVEPNTAHRLVPSEIADLALEFPHVDRLAANVGDGDPAAALLSMEEVELLQEVETGASGSFERIELLQASFEAEGLEVRRSVSARQREREREAAQ